MWSLVLAAGALLAASVASFAGPVYFVVAERPDQPITHGDSFIIPLERDDLIAHARDLIARGPEAAGATIVDAEVVAGSDGINRDVLAPGEPLWSWHVTVVNGFGDFGIELVDGNPTYLEHGDDGPGGEDGVAAWIRNTRRNPDDESLPGNIGFWNYTVVAELPPQVPAIPLPSALPAGALGIVAVIVLRRRILRRM